MNLIFFRETIGKKNCSVRAHPFLNVRLFSLIHSLSEYFFFCCRKVVGVADDFDSNFAVIERERRCLKDDVIVCEFDWASKKILSSANSIKF